MVGKPGSNSGISGGVRNLQLPHGMSIPEPVVIGLGDCSEEPTLGGTNDVFSFYPGSLENDGHQSIRAQPSSSSACSIRRSLPSSIAKELLRGVPAVSAMRKFGKHWSGSQSSDRATAEFTFSLSEEVHRLHDFLSHDWQTGRWVKFITLCFIYNSKAAFNASCAVCFVVCVLQLDEVGVLPKWPSVIPIDKERLIAGHMNAHQYVRCMMLRPP